MGTSNELPFKNENLQEKLDSLDVKREELREEMHNIWKLQTQIAVEACKQYADNVEILFTHVVKKEHCALNSNVKYHFFFNDEGKLGYFTRSYEDFHMTVFDIDFESFMQLLFISIERNIDFTVRQKYVTSKLSPTNYLWIENGKMREVGGVDFNNPNLLEELRNLLP